MRIIRGRYRGKALHPPAGLRARPTTDFAKEALFNIIENQFDIPSCRALDLFAGTGSIGYEFASRGAGHVDSVESDPYHVRYIAKTIRELELDNLSVHRADVFSFLKKGSSRRYDIVFADPPYNLSGIPGIPELVFGNGFVEKGGWLILEHGRNQEFSSHPYFFDHRVYGSVHFSFFCAV